MDENEKSTVDFKNLLNNIKNSMKEIKSSLDFIKFSIREDKTTLLQIDKTLAENKYTLTNINSSLTYAIQTLTSTKKRSDDTFKSIYSTLDSLINLKESLYLSEEMSEESKQLFEKSIKSLEESKNSLEKSLSPLKNGFYFLDNSKQLLTERVRSLRIFQNSMEAINDDSLNIIKTLSNNVTNELSLHDKLLKILFYPDQQEIPDDLVENTEIHLSEENTNQIKDIFNSINECNNSMEKKEYQEKLNESKTKINSFEEKIKTENDDSANEINTIISFFKTVISDIEENKKELDKIVPRWLLLGLDSSGKTTILYRLKLDKLVATIPTVGFNDETINFNGYKIRISEIGGQEKLRSLWKNSLTKSKAIIFVVDSSDSERIEEAKNELHKILQNEGSKECPLLVFANKQDLPEAKKPEEIIKDLELDNIDDRDIKIVGSCGTTGEGLNDGIKWVYEKLKSFYEDN